MAPQVSKSQLVRLLRNAGFPEQDIPTMVGIAGGESTYNPRAHNPNANTGDNSYGLFQINMLGAMGPERRKQFGIESNEQLFDPVTNVRAAKQIYDTQGLGAWTVYGSGKYKNFLPSSTEVAQGQGGTNTDLPVQPPTGYPGTVTVNNNYYGPYDSEFNKDPKEGTKDLIKTLLMQSLSKKDNGLTVPSISDLMKIETQVPGGYGGYGGYLQPSLYLQNQGIGLY